MDPRHHSGKPEPSQRQDFPLLEHLNLHHPLIVLARLIDRNAIDQVAYDAMGPRHRRFVATMPDSLKGNLYNDRFCKPAY